MGDNKTAVDRLNDTLNEKEAKIRELENKIDEAKYLDNWRWRHFSALSDADNLDLPVPRLEIRYRSCDDYNQIADYGIVSRQLCGDIIFIPFSSTKINGVQVAAWGKVPLPFRDGGNIKNDMWELKLPGYAVMGGLAEKISLDDRDDLPRALLKKMEATGTAL